MVAAGERGWLHAATRVTGVRRTTARSMLLALLLLLAGAMSIVGPSLTLGDQDHTAIVTAMRDGSSFYGLIAGIVPAGAFSGRLVPLPTLALVESGLGLLGTTILLCGVLAAILMTSWERLRALFAVRSGQVLGAVLVFGGGAAGALLTIEEPHAGWTALLTAWSLLLRRRERWIEAAALGGAAATIDPSALALVVTMAGAAIHERAPREVTGWMIAAALGLVTWSAHRVALSHLGVAAIGAGGSAAPIDVATAALLPDVPGWLALVTWVLALAGWSMVRGAFATRVAVVTIAGTALAFVPGMRSAATLTTVLLPLGLPFAVEAVASLLHQAFSRRRITVTRVAR